MQTTERKVGRSIRPPPLGLDRVNRWKGIISSFTGKLIKMIKDVKGRFDDYSISPKIRQILLYWGYEFVANDLL